MTGTIRIASWTSPSSFCHRPVWPRRRPQRHPCFRSTFDRRPPLRHFLLVLRFLLQRHRPFWFRQRQQRMHPILLVLRLLRPSFRPLRRSFPFRHRSFLPASHPVCEYVIIFRISSSDQETIQNWRGNGNANLRENFTNFPHACTIAYLHLLRHP